MDKRAIICVDDEPTVLVSLKTELRNAFREDYLIETAESGEEALELVAELLDENYEIPLIISDYIMPLMNGDELLKQVHQIAPKTLTVLLTGHATLEGVSNAINHAKLYRYINKPWETEDLKLTVKEAINSYLQEKKLAEQNAKLQQMNQELTALNHAQAALISKLHDNESRLQQFLEAMPVGVIVVDADGTLYYKNYRAQQLLGFEALANDSLQQLREIYQICFDSSEATQSRGEGTRQFNSTTINAVADSIEIRQGDRIIPIEAWGTPIYDMQGNITYKIVAFQDITERKKADSEREAFTHQLYQLNESFSRFVPRQFLYLLNKKSIIDVQLGDQTQKEMTVLFSDIRGFTSFSEKMTPAENFQFINAYLSRMEPAIVENNGFIDKYIGDAIMALFSGPRLEQSDLNTPYTYDLDSWESADDAVKAGISMLQRLHEYNQQRTQSGYAPIQIGIGINSGFLMLGTVGGNNRMDSTVISDAVNLAARVESLTKEYGASLLITHHTFLRLMNPGDYSIRLIDTVKVKGKSEWVTVYEVFDADLPEIREVKLATKRIFESALLFFRRQKFSEALQGFFDCLQQNPDDKVAKIYWQRCHQQLMSPKKHFE